MGQYATYGNPFKPGGGYQSGYNEVIVDGAVWEDRLPHSIEAFFAVETGNMAEVRDAHARFLSAYQLTARDVPLLMLRQTNWQEPFADMCET